MVPDKAVLYSASRVPLIVNVLLFCVHNLFESAQETAALHTASAITHARN